jgi:hypothetical protein
MGSKTDTGVEEKKQSRLVNGTPGEGLKVARRRKEDLRERIWTAHIYIFGALLTGSTRSLRCQKQC